MPTKKELEDKNTELMKEVEDSKFIIDSLCSALNEVYQRERTNKHRANMIKVFMWDLYDSHRKKGLNKTEARNEANQCALKIGRINSLKGERWLIENLKDDKPPSI